MSLKLEILGRMYFRKSDGLEPYIKPGRDLEILKQRLSSNSIRLVRPEDKLDLKTIEQIMMQRSIGASPFIEPRQARVNYLSELGRVLDSGGNTHRTVLLEETETVKKLMEEVSHGLTLDSILSADASSGWANMAMVYPNTLEKLLHRLQTGASFKIQGVNKLTADGITTIEGVCPFSNSGIGWTVDPNKVFPQEVVQSIAERQKRIAINPAENPIIGYLLDIRAIDI